MSLLSPARWTLGFWALRRGSRPVPHAGKIVLAFVLLIVFAAITFSCKENPTLVGENGSAPIDNPNLIDGPATSPYSRVTLYDYYVGQCLASTGADRAGGPESTASHCADVAAAALAERQKRRHP